MDLIYKIDYNFSLALNKLFHFRFLSFESVLMRYLKRLFRGIDVKDTGEIDPKSCLSNYVWIFWAQGEENMPDIVRNCYKSIKKNAGESNEVILLDMESIKQYVVIPDIVYEKLYKNKMSLTHFSDILRFSLLKDYGGWWIDATIFLTQELPCFESLFTIKNKYNESCVSRFMWSSFLWYIPCHHPFPRFVLNGLIRYWKNNDYIVDYLLLDYIIKYYYDHNTLFRREIESLPETNPDVYFFQTERAYDTFDILEWNEIMKNTCFFKTTYKKKIRKFSRDNYWRIIFKEEEVERE